MSQTADDSCPIPLNLTFNTDAYEGYYHQYQEQFIILGLLCGLYGVLTILSMMSCYVLLAKRSRRIQPTAIPLCLTILALFTSTTIYLVTCALQYHADFMGTFLASGENMWDAQSPGCGSSVQWNFPDMYDPFGFKFVSEYQPVQVCASAATLTVNVILGDAIICWRACTVWHKSRVVKAICGIFLLATIVSGAVDSTRSCRPSATPVTYVDDSPTAPGGLFEGIPIGIAACVLSLSTNILATVLIAYKAWHCRRRLKGYLVAKIGGSQVEKLLALLIESGAFYSVIWSVIVAYQVSAYKTLNELGPMSPLQSKFVYTFGVFMDGALVPVIAIYPTIIIVLVALNRSHIEKGISEHLESMLTPHLAITDNAVTSGRRSDVVIFDGQGYECGDSLEDASRRTSVGSKTEPSMRVEPPGTLNGVGRGQKLLGMRSTV